MPVRGTFLDQVRALGYIMPGGYGEGGLLDQYFNYDEAVCQGGGHGT